MNDGSTTRRRPRFISAVIRWRRCVLALWAAVVAASSFAYLSHFRIDNSVAIWFLGEDPELADYRRHNVAFGQREWTYVWLRGESVFNPGFLRDLKLVGDRVGLLEDVSQVVSLGELVGDSLQSENALSAAAGKLPGQGKVGSIGRMIRRDPMLEGRLIPRANDQFTILAVQNANRIHAVDPYRIRLIASIREVVADFPSILDSGIVGTTVINAELNRAAKRDMLVYYTLIAAFVLVAGGLALGSGRDVAVLVAVVTATVMPVLGAFGVFKLPFNLMTVMLPTLLVTVSVSYLIHFIGDFHGARRAQRDQACKPDVESAVSTTFAQLLRPGFWTSATTATGFASLTVSPVAPIQQIGIFAAVGIGLAWLATITVAPALLSLFWRSGSRPHRRDPADREGNRLLRWLAQPHPIHAALLGGLMLMGTLGLLSLKADTNYLKFFRAGSVVRNDYAQLEALGMPTSYLTLTVQLSENTRLADPGRHLAMRRFEQSLRALPAVVDVQSLDNRVSDLASGLVGDARIRSINSSLAQAQSGQLREVEEFLSQDGNLLRLRVMTGSMSTREINAFRADLDVLTAGQPREWDITLTGTNVLWSNMDAQVIHTQLLSIGITAAGLMILLPVVFRSLLLGVLGFAVSFVPVLCTLGLMGWIGLEVNIATCILGGVVMGIAVDDTIYYLSRFRENRRRGLSVDDAIRNATKTTGRAMIKTSLILTGGFLTMAASDFLPSVFFGVFFAFSILTTLLGDLILLPALLRAAQPTVR